MRFHTLSRAIRTLGLAAVVGAIVSACVAAVAPDRSAASRPAPVAVHSALIVGLADGAAGYGGASTARRLDQIRATSGASWFRDSFLWNRIEPRPGHFDFRYYDHYMLALAQRHMHVVPQVIGAPRWAAPSFWAVPSNPGGFATFVAKLVGRYGVGGTFWSAHPRLRGSAITAVELLNEPYFANGNAGDYDPGRYARLVRATALAARRVDPSVRLLIEADMATHHYRTWQWWVDSLYQAIPGLNRYFDGVAMHDYASNVTQLSPMRAGEPYANFDRWRRIENVRAQFVHHGAADKPFWIMETGFSTCRDHNVDCVSEPAQASDLRTVVNDVRGPYRSWVQAVFVYSYQDNNSGVGFYDGFGLVRSNGTPKPAMSVFKPLALASG